MDNLITLSPELQSVMTTESRLFQYNKGVEKTYNRAHFSGNLEIRIKKSALSLRLRMNSAVNQNNFYDKYVLGMVHISGVSEVLEIEKTGSRRIRKNYPYSSAISKMKYMFLLFPMILFMLSCTKQEAKMLLDSKDFISNVPINGTYKTTFEIKVKNKIVPMLATWDTYYDSTEHCNKFAKYTIMRTGGDPSVIFSNVDGRLDRLSFLKMDETDPNAVRNTSVTVRGQVFTYIGIQSNNIDAAFIELYSDGTFKELSCSFD